jgi:hypothetical protein
MLLAMRNWVVGVLLASAVQSAATNIPVGIFRGTLAAWQGTAAAGELTVRDMEGMLLSCGYDGRSYFERARQRVAVSTLTAGDVIELLADRRPGSQDCYTRTVHVIPPAPPVRPRASTPAPAAPKPTVERFQPRGDRTFAGVVIRREPGQLTIRTRDGEQTLRLRRDTRYFFGGLRAELAEVAVNTRVFVRAGRNLYGEIEAYQVSWGEILSVP